MSLPAQIWTRDPDFHPVLRNDMPALNSTHFAAGPDGRLLLYGAFTHLENNAFASPGVAYLRADGTVDPTFHAAVPLLSSVDAAVPLNDGGVLAIGYIGGARMLERYRADGTADPDLALNASGGASLLRTPDGHILAYGYALSLNNTSLRGLARFNADGTLDNTFNSQLPADLDRLTAVAAQSDGKVLVADAPSAGNSRTGRLRRLTSGGAVDTTFAAYESTDAISSIAVLPDGRIVVVAPKKLTRLTATGATESEFTGAIPDLQQINALVTRADGSLVVAAAVGTGEGPWPTAIFLLNGNGALLADLRTAFEAGQTFSLGAVQPDGSLWVTHGRAILSGAYTPFPSDIIPLVPIPPPVIVTANLALAHVSADFKTVRSIDAGLIQQRVGYISEAHIDSSSRLLIMGAFTHVDDVPRPGLARFTAEGTLDPTYAPDAPTELIVSRLVFAADGGVVGWRYEDPTGADYSRRFIRRGADGKLDPTFSPPTEYAEPTVVWHAITPEGNAVVSRFAPDNRSEANLRIEWLSPTGKLDRVLPTRFSGLSSGLPLVIVVPGTPTSGGSAGGQPDVTYANPLRFVQPLPDGKLMVSGDFTQVNGTPRRGLVRLNADGSIDDTYQPDFAGVPTTVTPWTVDDQGRVSFYGISNQTGQSVWIRFRLQPDGRRDPSFNYSGPPLYLPGPPFRDPLLWREDGLPDVTFPITYVNEEGERRPIYAVGRAPNGNVWTSSPLARFVPTDTPGIIVPPADATVTAGQDTVLLVGLSSRHPATYQWTFNGADIAGATQSYLVLTAITAAQGGAYRVRVTVDGQTFTSDPGRLTVIGGASHLVNFSGRANVRTGGSIVAGFVLSADGSPRDWLLRGVGPSLAKFGVTAPLVDPELRLYRDALLVGQDRGSILTPTITDLARQVGAFPALNYAYWWMTAWRTQESALVPRLASGDYTVQVTSATNASGPALVEVYDTIPPGASGALRNLSLRARTGNGTDIATMGFVIAGKEPLKLLVRGIGPTLAQFGLSDVLRDPRVNLYPGGATNSGWADDPSIAEAAKSVGAFALPPGSHDDALIVRLDPGAYTVQLTSVSGASGEGMIEVYVLDR